MTIPKLVSNKDGQLQPATREQEQMFDDYDPYEDERDDEGAFLDDAVMNCHMRSDGQCGAAGSEYCEFDCPFREQ